MWSPVGVTGRDAALPQFGQHGGGIDSQMLTNSGQRPTQVVQVDDVVDLFDGQAPAAHRHIVTVEDFADRPPFDSEPATQPIHRLPALISGDEFPDLIGTELTCPAGFGSVGGRRSGRGGVWKLPAEGFQGVYLVFYVVVSSPNVHPRQTPRSETWGFAFVVNAQPGGGSERGKSWLRGFESPEVLLLLGLMWF